MLFSAIIIKERGTCHLGLSGVRLRTRRIIVIVQCKGLSVFNETLEYEQDEHPEKFLVTILIYFRLGCSLSKLLPG